MAKPYWPTFEIVIKRKFDGKTEGMRCWSITSTGTEIDKLEDALAYLANAAMDHVPAVGKPATLNNEGETK